MIELNDQNYNNVVSNGNVVVIFSGQNCHYCKILERDIQAAQLESRYRHVVFARYMVSMNSQISRQFNIAGVPQIYLYRNGQPIRTMQGYNSNLENDIIQFYGRGR